MREEREPEVIIRNPNEANVFAFLDQNNDISPPVKISAAESIVDVKKFCDTQKAILVGGITQNDYDSAIRRIREFRKAINK